ncbi:MAG TPA: UvrD-helicase domain-containing protein [Clostridiales bacterium]|nr:UvrD-helicase domain-containing protein [Clostridiales bacterium]
MGIDRLKNIAIDDADIDWAESILNNDIHFDEERRNIIKNMDTVDIQAFPGSGKTTVLVSKLAILAKKWPFTHSGICVLSHTNVAREEIEERLGNTEVGKSLLSYPHFIGTMHSFFDTYISIPWLRSQGIKINMIDTSLVQNVRWRCLPWKIRSGLEYSNLNESVCSYKGSIGNINLGRIGSHTPTYKAVLSIIEESHKQGDFTFDEILLYTQEALENISVLPESMQFRFPLLFIDEAQDTNSFQWKLIHQIFNRDGDLSVHQGFGDENQAIFNYVNENVEKVEFPRKDPLFITKSRRFDSRIAALANPAALSCKKMIGCDNELSEKLCPHTVYLFEKDKIGKVIEEFSQLVLDTFSDDELAKYHKKGCHVIGMVHDKKEDTQPKHFPKGIYDYWQCYEAKKGNKNRMPQTLLEYFRNGKEEFDRTGETGGQTEWIAKGIRRLINIAKQDNFIVATKNPFKAMMEKIQPEAHMDFRYTFLQFISTEIGTKEKWDVLLESIMKMLPLFGDYNDKNLGKFLMWSNEKSIDDEQGTHRENGLVNHYKYYNSFGRTVDLEFGSIHSVKGRTHLATLVLETFSNSHNLKSILSYLCAAPPKTEVSTQNKVRLKCHYVAMTRAKGLLCLAIPIDSVNDNTQEKLKALGWKIKNLNNC